MVHSLCESVVQTGEYDVGPLKQELTEGDYARALMLFNNFLDVWRVARQYMDRPNVEEYLQSDLGSVTITGHLDVHQRYTDRAYVIDYKTGRQHENHYHQMIAYAYLVWDDAGQPEAYAVYVTAVYLEDKTTQSYTFTPPQLRQWAKEVEAKVQDRRFVVGRKCSFCTVQGSCEAYRGYVGGAIAALTENAHDQRVWEEMIPEDRGQLADAIYVLEKAIDRAKFGLRHAVRKAGALDIGGGNQYELIDQAERGIDAAKAMKVLKKRLPMWENHAAFRLEDVLVAYAATIPRGEKTKAKQALLAELENEGAIVRAVSTKMFRRPKNERKLDEHSDK